MSIRNENLFKNVSNNPLFGKKSLILLLFILKALWIYFSIYPDDSYNYIFGFYLVGCLIIGPIESIFAYFFAIFSTIDHFD